MSNEIKQQLAILKEKYLISLPNKMDNIRMLWETLIKREDDVRLEELHRMVHSLVGSSATFGMVQVSQSAKNLENHIKKYTVQPNDLLKSPSLGEIESLFHCLENSVNAKK